MIDVEAPPETPRLGTAGAGRLDFVRRGARTVVTRAIADSPLRLLTPRNHGNAAWVYAATYGGGLVGGDAISLDVSVGRDATAMLSTQASTKVYRSERGTSMTLRAAVAAGGLIALLPDPVVLFAGSTYRQSQRVDLEAGASLILFDAVTSGRRAAGERWRFDHYSSRLEVHQDGRLVLLDALSLVPAEGDLEARFGRFNVVCVIVLIGPALASHARATLARLAARPVVTRADLLVGASPVTEHGCTIRIAGVAFEEVAAAAHECLAFVPSLLGDDPRARKW